MCVYPFDLLYTFIFFKNSWLIYERKKVKNHNLQPDKMIHRVFQCYIYNRASESCHMIKLVHESHSLTSC